MLFDGEGGHPPLDVAMFDYRSLFRAVAQLKPGADIDFQAQKLAGYFRELGEEYQDIFVVAHSLGGLLAEAAVEQFLSDMRWKDENSAVSPVAALIFMASPLAGSTKARFPLFFFRDIRRLRVLSSEQGKIRSFFTSHVQAKTIASEKPFDFLVPRYAGLVDTDVAVSSTSAIGSVPSDQCGYFKGSHSSIAKPDEPTDPQHVWLLRIVREVQEVRTQWHREDNQRRRIEMSASSADKISIVTEMRFERRRGVWDRAYNDARANSSKRYAKIRDRDHAGIESKVNLLITVHEASEILSTDEPRATVEEAVLDYASGDVLSVAVCPVGIEFLAAERAVLGWLPVRYRNKFYVEGSVDVEGFRENMMTWIDAVIHGHPERQQRAVVGRRLLARNFDPYEEGEDL